MWSYKLFRIGALILALCGSAHLLGFLASKSAKAVNNPIEFQLRELMYGYKANIMGTMRTQGEIFDGLNLSFGILLLTLAALGFTMPVQRKTGIVIAVSMAAMLGVSLTYWFIMPTSFIAAALLCYAGSAYLEK